MAALSPETQTGAALHRAEVALATLREAMALAVVLLRKGLHDQAIALLLAPSGNGEESADER